MVLHGRIAVTRTTVIIRTNGVSFSLVAGAICLVTFSYAIKSPKASTNAGSWTLNINSTGAKNFIGYAYYRNFSGSTVTSEGWNTYSSSDTKNGYSPGKVKIQLFLYTGANFVTPSGDYTTEYWTYTDYWDT